MGVRSKCSGRGGVHGDVRAKGKGVPLVPFSYGLQIFLCKLRLASKRSRGGEGGRRGDGSTHIVHRRSRMTIALRIPTMPGRSPSRFHRPGRHCLHQARRVVRCSASRMKRVSCILLRTAFEADISCIWLTASNESICLLVWPQQWAC